MLWCPWRESDPRPLPYQGSALPLSHMGNRPTHHAQALTFNSLQYMTLQPIGGAGDGDRTRIISLEG
jgi:hypothetical protein